MDQFCFLDILSSVTFVSPKGLTFDQTVRTWSSISRLNSANIHGLLWHILHILNNILHILNNILHILHRPWSSISRLSSANIHGLFWHYLAPCSPPLVSWSQSSVNHKYKNQDNFKSRVLFFLFLPILSTKIKRWQPTRANFFKTVSMLESFILLHFGTQNGK